MAEYKEWAVELVITSEHSYTVLARTAEEAVGLAEDLYDSGDMGQVCNSSIETADAMSADIYTESEDEEEIIFEPERAESY
jgi:hypothetical protein